MTEDDTFHEVRGDVDSGVVSGRGAGEGVAQTEAWLAACWVFSLEVEKAWPASVDTHTLIH